MFRLPRKAEQTLKPPPNLLSEENQPKEFKPDRSWFYEIKSHEKMGFRMEKCHLSRNTNKTVNAFWQEYIGPAKPNVDSTEHRRNPCESTSNEGVSILTCEESIPARN